MELLLSLIAELLIAILFFALSVASIPGSLRAKGMMIVSHTFMAASIFWVLMIPVTIIIW